MIDTLGWLLVILGGASAVFGFVWGSAVSAPLGFSLFGGGIFMTILGFRMMAYAERGMQRDRIRLANSKNR